MSPATLGVSRSTQRETLLKESHAAATRGFGSVTIATHGASTVLEIAPLIMRRGKFGAGAANVENMLRCMLLRGAARSVRLRRRERGCVYGESEAP